jgi:hypothetical protein
MALNYQQPLPYLYSMILTRSGSGFLSPFDWGPHIHITFFIVPIVPYSGRLLDPQLGSRGPNASKNYLTTHPLGLGPFNWFLPVNGR